MVSAGLHVHVYTASATVVEVRLDMVHLCELTKTGRLVNWYDVTSVMDQPEH